MVRLALGELGVSRRQQERALVRSQHLKTPPNVSGRVLRAGWGGRGDIARMVAQSTILRLGRQASRTGDHWARGDFRKSGATVFAQHALRGGCGARVRELGSGHPPGVIRSRSWAAFWSNSVNTREKYLAHAIRQIDQLLQTLLHNRRLGGRSAADGRMERMVMGVISRANFKPLMRDLRPQIYDLLLRVDSSIEHYQPKTARSLRAGTAVSVSVYVGQEDDLERAGLDTSPVALAERRARPKKRSILSGLKSTKRRSASRGR